MCGQPAPADQPYKVLKTEKVGGPGGWDYVYADADGRRLYIPRGNRITVFDLDSLKSQGEIPNTNGVHGVAVDPKSNHGFSSSKPVVMWDTKTLTTIKTIDVQGNPDGILFDPSTEHVFVLSHRDPNVTVINAADGSIVGTIDLGGAPEEGASDGNGRVYIDVEDKDNVAVIDAKALSVTAHYDLGGKGGGPAGLAMDVKNHILFAFCREPANVVILNADDGKIVTSLPIGNGVDAAEFNPNTMEAFSSQGDGTLSVIKENSPTDFAVEQTVQTKRNARTSTLDLQTGQIFLITADFAPPATQPASTQPTAQTGRRNRRGTMVPDSFTIQVVGK
ncbi:MAG TPA: hypothetical protein VKK61_12085 [Tepidisphaeraceae bacterium]|nr:hypothetical protein [Tepidisphaeraceae bacterium]